MTIKKKERLRKWKKVGRWSRGYVKIKDIEKVK